ncbi:CBF-domain-containing protein [Basidiobolus meristosporus CBS 931.73]|uniref:CBF-domain-containing protein n=1 Tax=Basidiobolus meristosporus CBS 931.73 TaxID=1314790 RepID=A0A1Y1ZE89_9FUNG|nr:CBF-domain-containing protein [Basidiobolus meristosporus CBS 931.73]|eukprot:ORY08287.1 CBF-domain-containing protein [Basidiobolus meristosporus CBS 931.73]
MSENAIEKKKEQARELFERENTNYEAKKQMSGSDKTFLSTVINTGTLNDKVSALTLLVGESPIHSHKTLTSLLAMAKKKNRREALMTVASLKDLMLNNLLPDRKLKHFQDQPIGHPKVTPAHLIVWYFEDFLKQYYFEIIQLIEVLSQDPVGNVKTNMAVYISELLSEKPEQEQNLLKLLINKLGDTDRKLSSKVSFLVLQLLVKHPNMKFIVAREIEGLLFRTNIHRRAQYSGIITLNQMILTSADVVAANKLIDIYFTFFKKLLSDQKPTKGEKTPQVAAKKKAKGKKKKNESPNDVATEDSEVSKIIAAILTGVNRAFPFARVEDDIFDANLDTLFKITHTSTFNVVVQALSLIYQVSSSKQAVSDRFYRALYDSLLDPRLANSSKQAMYLNLIFKSLKADVSLPRVMGFVKRIVQICGHHQPPFICGALFLVSELIQSNQGIRALIFQPENDDDEEHFEDVKDSDDEEEHFEDVKEGEDGDVASKAEQTPRVSYDGRKRDPRFTSAEKSCLWELVPFADHFHPTVAMFANQLLKGDRIHTQPQLHLHTIMHFLDRFVYRNPKKKSSTLRGASIHQPMDYNTTGGVVWKRGAGISDVTVNSEAFWRKKAAEVPVDEVFFHKFFSERSRMQDTINNKKKKRKHDDDSDEGEPLGDSDEDEIWQAMTAGMPNVEDDDDDEDDSELDDLSVSESESDEEAEGSEDEPEDMEDADSAEEAEDVDSDDFGEDELPFGDDEEDLVGSDEEVPVAEPEEEESNKGRKKRRKAKDLPTFASYEDYASMLD